MCGSLSQNKLSKSKSKKQFFKFYNITYQSMPLVWPIIGIAAIPKIPSTNKEYSLIK